MWKQWCLETECDVMILRERDGMIIELTIIKDLRGLHTLGRVIAIFTQGDNFVTSYLL